MNDATQSVLETIAAQKQQLQAQLAKLDSAEKALTQGAEPAKAVKAPAPKANGVHKPAAKAPAKKPDVKAAKAPQEKVTLQTAIRDFLFKSKKPMTIAELTDGITPIWETVTGKAVANRKNFYNQIATQLKQNGDVFSQDDATKAWDLV